MGENEKKEGRKGRMEGGREGEKKEKENKIMLKR